MRLQRRCTFMREISWLLHWEILIYWHVGDIELWVCFSIQCMAL